MVLIISNIVSTIGIDSFDIEKKIGVRRVTTGIPLQSQRQSRSLNIYKCTHGDGGFAIGCEPSLLDPA